MEGFCVLEAIIQHLEQLIEVLEKMILFTKYHL